MYISVSGFTTKCFLMASKQFEDVFKSLLEYPIHWICPHLPSIIEINCTTDEKGGGALDVVFFLNRD